MLTVNIDNNDAEDAIFYRFTLYKEMQINFFLKQTIT